MIFILDMETGSLRNIRNPQGYLFALGPRWSTDGKSIAFGAFPHTFGPDEIWYGDILVYDVENMTTKVESNHDEAEEMPEWLDEDMLVIDGTHSGDFCLSALDVKTGEHKPLAHDPKFKDAWADVSPDGEWLVFKRTPIDVFEWQPVIMNLKTGALRTIETGLLRALFPRSSADGKANYFHSQTATGESRLYRLDLDDSAAGPEMIEIKFE